MADEASDSILLVIPVPVHFCGAELHIEPQAANGLERWLENFEAVTVCCRLEQVNGLTGSRPISGLKGAERLSVELFGSAWSPPRFLFLLPVHYWRLYNLIKAHRYLQLAIGGAWGDWGSVAAVVAARQGRQFAVWTDRVESAVMRRQADEYSGLRRAYRRLNAWLAENCERWVISRSALGLFHGMDTFHAFSKYCNNPRLVHNIHLKSNDKIDAIALGDKLIQSSTGPLRIVYAGRLDPDKGPLEWVEALRLVSSFELDFEANWYGEGPCRAEVVSLLQSWGLEDKVHLPGQISDRATILDALRRAHMMVFCHLTPESPRCLIEALICGTPIVGYKSAYSADLISQHGGGVLVEWNSQDLALAIKRLAQDRNELSVLIEKAAKDGSSFNDEQVFSHRSSLIRSFA